MTFKITVLNYSSAFVFTTKEYALVGFYDFFSISLYPSIIFTEYWDDKWSINKPLMWIHFCPVASARQAATSRLSKDILNRCRLPTFRYQIANHIFFQFQILSSPAETASPVPGLAPYGFENMWWDGLLPSSWQSPNGSDSYKTKKQNSLDFKWRDSVLFQFPRTEGFFCPSLQQKEGWGEQIFGSTVVDLNSSISSITKLLKPHL